MIFLCSGNINNNSLITNYKMFLCFRIRWDWGAIAVLNWSPTVFQVTTWYALPCSPFSVYQSQECALHSPSHISSGFKLSICTKSGMLSWALATLIINGSSWFLKLCNSLYLFITCNNKKLFIVHLKSVHDIDRQNC